MVEIELSPRTTERLTSILLGYLTQQTYDRVQVRCGTPALRRQIDAVVERVGGVPTIEVVEHQ